MFCYVFYHVTTMSPFNSLGDGSAAVPMGVGGGPCELMEVGRGEEGEFRGVRE